MRILDLFTAHPHSAGQSYWRHLLRASCFSYKLATAAIVVFVHALLPFLFTHTASHIVTNLYMAMRNGYKDNASKPPS